MDNEDDFFLNKEELTPLIEKCENMLMHQKKVFFDVLEFIELLDFYIDNAKFDKALTIVNIALHQHPYVLELEFRKAEIYIEQNNADDALAILMHICKIEPENADALFMIGIAHCIKGSFKNAIQMFDAYIDIEHDVEPEELYYNVAVSLLNHNQYKYALHYLKKSYNLNQNNALVVYDLAYCFEAMQDFSKSIQFYKEYINLDPYSQIAWYNLGVIYTQCKKLKKAVRAFDFALAIDEYFSSALFNKANCLADLELYHDAVNTYLEFLKCEPDSIIAHIYIAECYEKIKDFEQAEAYYFQAIELDSECAEAWFGLGTIKFFVNEVRMALRYFEKTVEIEPHNEKYLTLYGMALYREQIVPAAIGAIKKAIQINQFNVDAWMCLAEIYMFEGKIDDAIKCLKQARKQSPHYKISYTLAAYCANSQDVMRAKKYFSEAYTENAEESDIFFDICILESNVLQEFRNIMF